MPSYCDSHPVPPSIYSDAPGPVNLVVGGSAEELVEASHGMDVDWETQLRVAHNSVRLEQLGWKEGDWSSAWSSSASSGKMILCLDSNVLVSHLPVLMSVHQALLSSPASSSGLCFLVPATVLRELDGLKSSTTPADRRGGPTVGGLAQRAVGWLVEVKRLEREHGLGRGLLIGDQLDMNSQYAMEDNDGLILAAAVDTIRRAPAGTRLALWTEDANLQARAELQDVPTISPRAPVNPHVFLHSLGVYPAEGDVHEVEMEQQQRSPTKPTNRLPTAAQHRPPARQRPPPPPPSPAVTPSPYDNLLPFEAMLVILDAQIPPAVLRRLTSFHERARDAYDAAGLPYLEDLRHMVTLPLSFQILELIWRHQDGGWRSSDLAPRKRRRPKPPSPPTSPSRPPLPSQHSATSHVSMHAKPTARSPRSPSTSPVKSRLDADADLLPPSAAHIRSHVLPALGAFCARPSLDGMPDFLEALESVFFGAGGRAFLGPTGWAELVRGVERCWAYIDSHHGGEDRMFA